MSSHELKRFLENVRTNPDLVEELRTLLPNPDAVIRWAAERGFPLTLEDVTEIQGSDQELSDDELDKVAGGDTAWPPPPPPSPDP